MADSAQTDEQVSRALHGGGGAGRRGGGDLDPPTEFSLPNPLATAIAQTARYGLWLIAGLAVLAFVATWRARRSA